MTGEPHDDVVSRARAALDGITPGEWWVFKQSERHDDDPEWVIESNGGPSSDNPIGVVGHGVEQGEVDATFIAEAPDLVRALADELEAVRRSEQKNQRLAIAHHVAKDDLQIERDELRAEVERLTTMHEWPKTTPTGHVYVAPTTYDELRSRHTDAAQASVECWVDAECPPEPTWEMVGLAHREVERLTEANAELVKRGLGAAEARDEARTTVDRVRKLCDDASAGPLYERVVRAALDGEA